MTKSASPMDDTYEHVVNTSALQLSVALSMYIYGLSLIESYI